MTVPVTKGDENGSCPGVEWILTFYGPKAVSGSGTEKPADESDEETWRNNQLSPLPRRGLVSDSRSAQPQR
jgi:hypothetical protein